MDGIVKLNAVERKKVAELLYTGTRECDREEVQLPNEARNFRSRTHVRTSSD